MDRTSGDEADGKRISRATITEQLEGALRVDILTGILPPGSRIRASEMAERYGVSATPLREALQRLAGESLVELDPRLGATVAHMSERDLRDIYGMLARLDSLALERSIRRGDDRWVANVERAWAALTDAVARREALGDQPDDRERREAALEWSAAHWSFHEALYEASDSPWLMRFVRQLHAHADRYQLLTMQRTGAQKRDSRSEHEQILRAALARDADTALAALRDHFALTVRILLDEAAGVVAPASGAEHLPPQPARLEPQRG